jgi:predicted nucleotidyltransferase
MLHVQDSGRASVQPSRDKQRHARQPGSDGDAQPREPERTFVPRTDHGRILADHRSTILALAHEFGFSNVRVFGSAAKGTDDADSDIDLLVDREPTTGLFNLSRFEIAVARVVGLPVDVVPSALNPRIARHVLDDAVPL